MAVVYSLTYQPKRSNHQQPPYRFNRQAVDSVTLIANHGIEGDVKAGKSPKRQLNLMSHETLLMLREEGYQTAPGEMGEQITIQGFDVMTLKPGDRLQLGESAVIEMTTPRTPCHKVAKVQGKPQREAAGRMGIMARVLTGGVVRVGDSVTVLEVVNS